MSYIVFPKSDVKKCKVCEGNSIVYFWRSDLEDFDEILCPKCNESEK